MKLEVKARWRIADDAVEGGVQKYEYQSQPGEFPPRFSSDEAFLSFADPHPPPCSLRTSGRLHETFAGLKTENNRLLTAWLNGKKMKVEEIDVLEEKVPDDDEDEEDPAAKKQKTED